MNELSVVYSPQGKTNGKDWMVNYGHGMGSARFETEAEAWQNLQEWGTKETDRLVSRLEHLRKMLRKAKRFTD